MARGVWVPRLNRTTRLHLSQTFGGRYALDDGTPIPRSSAECLLCTARVAAMVLRIAEDGTIETLGITDPLSDATRRQRRALKL